MTKQCPIYVINGRQNAAVPHNGLLQRILQEGVLEAEVLLDSRAPAGFVIKVNVRPLFVLICCDLWFLVALEPSHVLFVKAPALLLQLASSKILLVRALSVVKDEKQAVRSELFKHRWIVKDRRRRRRVRHGSRVRILRRVLTRSLDVTSTWSGDEGFVESR